MNSEGDNRTNLVIPSIGGAVGRTYVENDLKFKKESNRLASFSEWWENDVSYVKLARYGFTPLGNIIIECTFGAEIMELQARRYSEDEILAFHHPVCPVITGVDYDNIPIRTRHAEDSDGDRSLLHLMDIRAPAIRARQFKEGVPELNSEMVLEFKELYSDASIRTAIQNHFEENGLFPTREMLFERLDN